MAVQTYVGARYVPKFSDLNGGDWDNQYSYEALEIVKNGNDYYTAKKPVPVGIDISNTDYWVLTGNYNGAISTLAARVQTLEDFAAANDYFVTPEDYGAVADGSTDCTQAIQDAIDNNPDAIIYFNKGTYVINDTIYAKKGIHFLMDPNAEIRLDSVRPCMIYDNIADAQGDTNLRSYRSMIRGGIINANNNAQIAIGYNYCIGATFADIKIINFTQVGIYGAYNIDGASDYINGSNYHANLYISKVLTPNDSSTGIRCDGEDNFYNDITIVDCRYGIHLLKGGHKLYNIHPWVHAGNFAGSIAFVINGVNMFSNCTSDSIQTAIKIESSGTWFFADNFRAAFHIIPFTEVTAAGGFNVLETNGALSPTAIRVIISNAIIFVDGTYTSGGKFMPDALFANKAVYDCFNIKNMKGTSQFANMANLINDAESSDFLGAILPSGADLNDYTVAGKWCANTTALANSITNTPMSGPFTLVVERNTSYTRQHFYGVSLSGIVTEYYRNITSSQQQPWIAVGTP